MPPFHFVLVFTFRLAPPATMAACGRFLILVSLVFEPVFSFNLGFFVSPPPATRTIRGRVLTVVGLAIAPFSSRPHRQSGGTRQILTASLPSYGVCVSFNYFLPVFPGFIARPFRGVGVGFEERHLRLMVLVSGTGISPNFPYFCIYAAHQGGLVLCVTDKSIRVCHVTDPAELRQSATTDISTSRRGQQHELRSAELVKERRPKGRRVLLKSGLKWCWREVRECACTLDQSPYKRVIMTHRYE